MAVYNKLTQNKQGKGPVFCLVEKLHTLTWVALARGENKQPTNPPSTGQMLCCKTYLYSYSYLYIYISTEGSWGSDRDICLNQGSFQVCTLCTRTEHQTLMDLADRSLFFHLCHQPPPSF